MYKLKKYQSLSDYNANIVNVRLPNVSKVFLNEGHIVKYNSGINYIENGLILFLDGRLNTGTSYNANATTWTDRVNGYIFSPDQNQSSAVWSNFEFSNGKYVTAINSSTENTCLKCASCKPNFGSNDFTVIHIFSGTVPDKDYIFGTAGFNWDANNRWQLVYNPSQLRLAQHNGSWGFPIAVTTPATSYTVAILTKSGNTLSFYLNGTLAGTATTDRVFGGSDNGVNLRITQLSNYGYMLYNRALTSDEIETTTNWAFAYYELESTILDQ